MERHFHRSRDSRFIFAIGIIIVGVLLLLDNLPIHWHHDPWEFWPVLLILLGASKIARHNSEGHGFGGIVLLGLGGILLANNLDLFPWLHLGFQSFWPLLIIAVGINILFSTWHGPRPAAACTVVAGTAEESCNGDDTINISAILSGGDYNYESKKMKGGRVTAILGGCKLNFRYAEIEGDSMHLDCSVIMGGVEIVIPDHWSVAVRGTPIMGAIENKTHRRVNGADTASPKTLIITGSAIMGGIEIKN